MERAHPSRSRQWKPLTWLHQSRELHVHARVRGFKPRWCAARRERAAASSERAASESESWCSSVPQHSTQRQAASGAYWRREREREREPSPSPVIALDGEQCEGAALSLVLVSRSAARRLRQAAPTRLQVPHTSLLPPTLTTRGENGLLRCQKYVSARCQCTDTDCCCCAPALRLHALTHTHTDTTTSLSRLFVFYFRTRGSTRRFARVCLPKRRRSARSLRAACLHPLFALSFRVKVTTMTRGERAGSLDRCG
jgi:hypothetical protein